jgi:hypothetical protein
MIMDEIDSIYIDALLADAAYVELTKEDGSIMDSEDTSDALAKRLTQPQADFIVDNFEVLAQPGDAGFWSTDGGFSATVWRGKENTNYAGQVYLSMRGTAQLEDFADDAVLAKTGVAYDQLVDMVNWWTRATTPAGEMVPQISALDVGQSFSTIIAAEMIKLKAVQVMMSSTVNLVTTNY